MFTASEELLIHLNHTANQLQIPAYTANYPDAPAPDTYVVFTPMSEWGDLYADNLPGIDAAEVRVSLFTKRNYLTLAQALTTAFLQRDLTVTARTYVGYETDTGYHHYTIDVTHHRPTML